jgi:translation initiation factor IF-3
MAGWSLPGDTSRANVIEFFGGRAILQRLRTNEQIRIPKVRVIDQNGNQLGIMVTIDAIRLARQDDLDLVEVSPKETPPVCRILDYGKWKYQQQKKEHDSRKRQHVQELKEIRLRPKTDEHDLDIKLRKAREFLEEGAKVQITMVFRGRERLHRDIGEEMFREMTSTLDDIGKVEREARLEGRRMIMIMIPKPGAVIKPKASAAKNDEADAKKPQRSGDGSTGSGPLIPETAATSEPQTPSVPVEAIGAEPAGESSASQA